MTLRKVAPIVVVALAVVIVGIVLLVRGDNEPEEADVEGLESFSGLTNDHVERAVVYDDAPPVGGDHYPAWMDCGAYDAPVADEFAVHNLEHGGIWIAYDPALTADQVATLAEQLPGNGIMSPYQGLESPVAVMSWERRLTVDDVDDDRIATFVETYENSPIAPESGQVSCNGGITADEAATLAEQAGL